MPEEGSLAGAVDTAIGEETPTTDVTTGADYEGPDVDSPKDVKTPDVLSKPAGQVVEEALNADADETADGELGKASLEIDGDLDDATDDEK